MKTKNQLMLLAAVAVLGMPACAIQGNHSLRPHGITLNRSLRLGADAFEPNPFITQPSSPNHVSYVRDEDYSPIEPNGPQHNNYITNNFYTETIHSSYPETDCSHGPSIIITPTY
jgi:hypothetical protein